MARLEVDRALLVKELNRMAKVLGRGRGGEAVPVSKDDNLLLRMAGRIRR